MKCGFAQPVSTCRLSANVPAKFTSVRRMKCEQPLIVTLWAQILIVHWKGTRTFMKGDGFFGNNWLPICVSVLLGLSGCPNGCVLWWGGRSSIPLFVFSACCLCTLRHAVYNFQSVDTNGQQVRTHPTPLSHYTLPVLYSCKALIRVLCLSAHVSSREKEYDDIDEEDPFNPQARRISYNSRSNIQSFCSYTSSLSSQASFHPPLQTASNVLPPPEYM